MINEKPTYLGSGAIFLANVDLSALNSELSLHNGMMARFSRQEKNVTIH
jgi:hypothetical protein